MELKLFNNHRLKLSKIIAELLKDNDNFYCFTVSITGISIQGSYKAIYVKRLILRGFEFSDSEQGYLYFTKHVAGVKIQFILTD